MSMDPWEEELNAAMGASKNEPLHSGDLAASGHLQDVESSFKIGDQLPSSQTPEPSGLSNTSFKIPLRPHPIHAAEPSQTSAGEFPRGETSESAPEASEHSKVSRLNPPSMDPPDTLVFIDYPQTAVFRKWAGYYYPLHVHSASLLACGSKVFRDLLSPTRQFRILRRRNIAKRLPEGIKYVLDLTPPDEGDEAVNLIADLSLSLGIRKWKVMVFATEITNKMAGGSDESADADLLPNLPARRKSITLYDTVPRTLQEERLDLEAAIMLSKKTGHILSEAGPSNNVAVPHGGNEAGRKSKKAAPNQNKIKPPRTLHEEEADFQTALLLSETMQRDGYEAAEVPPESDSETSEQDKHEVVQIENGAVFGTAVNKVPEYSDIRHRLGIHRLLQVLEGRTPDLDSAPKVWTLWTLAKYFDCTSSVVDCVRKWMTVWPNSLFIEVLPEMSAKIGLGLQDPQISKAAFSILVGEEALGLLCRRREEPDSAKSAFTPFGRQREDIDEDLKNRIEYASKAFEERVTKTFDHLFSRELSWLESLPEFKKLLKFQQAMKGIQDDRRMEWTRRVALLRELTTSVIRRRILSALCNHLNSPHYLVISADDPLNGVKTEFQTRRRYNSFMASRNLFPVQSAEHALGLRDKLSIQERVFTRPFWNVLNKVGFTLHDLSCGMAPNLYGEGHAYASQENIGLVTSSTLSVAAENFDEAILEAVSLGFVDFDTLRPETVAPDITDVPDFKETYTDVAYKFQREEYLDFWVRRYVGATFVSPWRPDSVIFGSEHSSHLSAPDLEAQRGAQLHGLQANNENPDSATVEKNQEASSSDPFKNWWDWEPASSSNTEPKFLPAKTHPLNEDLADDSASTKTLRDDMDVSDEFHAKYTAPSSPFLNLSRLLNQVDKYCKDIIHTMVSTSNLPFVPQNTDILVSLTDNEFKYLPVSAGGQDDGTGAVFTDAVPEGIGGLVPIGPGPFFKTGFSSVGSSVGTDSESIFGSEYTDSPYDGSAVVEDGYSGVFPRMRVMKDSDIASLALSDAGTEVGADMGKAKGKVREMGPVITPGTSVFSGSVVSGDESVGGSMIGKNDGEQLDHNMGGIEPRSKETEEEYDDDNDTTVDDASDTDHVMKDEEDEWKWGSGEDHDDDFIFEDM